MAYFKDDLPRTETFSIALILCSNWHDECTKINSGNNKDCSILCFGCI
jgi:hypothetical protein